MHVHQKKKKNLVNIFSIYTVMCGSLYFPLDNFARWHFTILYVKRTYEISRFGHILLDDTLQYCIKLHIKLGDFGITR